MGEGVPGSLLGAMRNLTGCELGLHKASMVGERALKIVWNCVKDLGLSCEERRMRAFIQLTALSDVALDLWSSKICQHTRVLGIFRGLLHLVFKIPLPFAVVVSPPASEILREVSPSNSTPMLLNGHCRNSF
jgi:hypothetical protein